MLICMYNTAFYFGNIEMLIITVTLHRHVWIMDDNSILDTKPLSLNTTIGDVKLLIYQFCKLAVWNQTIIFNGKSIKDDSRNLLQCGMIYKGSHIFVVRKNHKTIKCLQCESIDLKLNFNEYDDKSANNNSNRDPFLSLKSNTNNPVLIPMSHYEIMNLQTNEFIYFRSTKDCFFQDAIVRHVEKGEYINVQTINNMNCTCQDCNQIVTIDFEYDKIEMSRCFGKLARVAQENNHKKKKYETIPKRDHLLMLLLTDIHFPRVLAEIIVDYAHGFVFHLKIKDVVLRNIDIDYDTDGENCNNAYVNENYSDWSSIILSHALSLKKENVFSLKGCDPYYGETDDDTIRLGFKFGIICLSKKHSLPIKSYLTPFEFCKNKDISDIFCQRDVNNCQNNVSLPSNEKLIFDSESDRENKNCKRDLDWSKAICTHFITVLQDGKFCQLSVSSQGDINTQQESDNGIDIFDDVMYNQEPLIVKFIQSKTKPFMYELMFIIGNYTIKNSRAVVDCSKYECYLALSGPCTSEYSYDNDQVDELDFAIDRIE